MVSSFFWGGGAVKRNQDQGQTALVLQCGDYFGLRWRLIGCLFLAYAGETDCQKH